MKKFLTLIFLLFILSCSKRYEYKQIIIEAESKPEGVEDYIHNTIPVSVSKLNALGAEGWELVTAYPVIETVFPDLGREEGYVINVRTNTRTLEVVYVFKRRI